MWAANMWWEVHLMLLTTCASRLRSARQDRHQQEPRPLQCLEAREEEEDAELIVMTGLCILGSHQPTCEGNMEPANGSSLPGMQDQWGVLLRDYATHSIWILNVFFQHDHKVVSGCGLHLLPGFLWLVHFVVLGFVCLFVGFLGWWVGFWVYNLFCLLVAFGFVFVLLCLFVFPRGNLGVVWPERVAVTIAI